MWVSALNLNTKVTKVTNLETLLHSLAGSLGATETSEGFIIPQLSGFGVRGAYVSHAAD